MPEACDIHGTAFKNGSLTLLARVIDNDGNNVVPAAINSVKYNVCLLDDQNPDARAPVEGHNDVGLSVANVLYGSLQTDAVWTVDSIGYNFRHVLDVSSHPAFAVAGRRYLVEYQLTPAAGQVVLVRFRINVI